MPIARIQMPDGRIGRFEVPEGATESDIMAFVQSQNIPMPEENINPALRGVGRGARTAATGLSSALDIAALPGQLAAAGAQELGYPETAQDIRKYAGIPISQSIKSIIDQVTEGKLKPQNAAERIVDTMGEFGMGAGAISKGAAKIPALSDTALAQFNPRDLLAATSSGVAYQGVDELGGNEYAKTAAAMLTPALTLSAPTLAKTGTESVSKLANVLSKSNIPQRAEQELYKTLQGTVPTEDLTLAAQKLPEQTLQRGQEAISRTPEAEQLAMLKAKQLETQGRAAIPIKGVMGEAEATKAAAEGIKDSLKIARKEITTPIYKEAFQTEGRFDIPQNYFKTRNAGKDPFTGFDVKETIKNPAISSLESNPAFQEAKRAVLDRTKPEDIARGYYNPKENLMSSQMLNDIHSELRNYASGAERSIMEGAAKDARSYNRTAEQTLNVLEKGLPENKLQLRNAGNAAYKKFSNKIENIFGENDRGLVGNLLKFDELDARSSEKVINQMNDLFKKEPQKILDVKNTFKEFGQEPQFNKAFSAYLQYTADRLPENKSLYDYFAKNKQQARQFYLALPKGNQNNAQEAIRIGHNINIMRNKAFDQKVGTEEALKTVGRIAAPKTGGLIEVAKNTFNKYSGKNAIDKELVNILFDPKRSEEFLSNLGKYKTMQEKQNYVIKYLDEYGASTKGAAIRTPLQINSQQEQQDNQ